MQYILAIILAIFLYSLQDTYYKRRWKDDLTIRIEYNRTYANIGDTLELTEVVENRKRLPLPVLCVKFMTSKSFEFERSASAAISDHYYRNDAFSIPGSQQIIRKLPFRVTKRGYYKIDSVHLVARDLFLIKTYATIEENAAFLYVYPRLLTRHRELHLANTIIGDILTRSLYTDPLSFRGIRDYHSGDSMRYINWKSTAKNETLQVNTFYDTQQAHVALFVNLDTRKPGNTDHLKEYILSIAATLIQQLNNHGVSISLSINSTDCLTGQPIFIPEGNGTEHLHRLFQAISRTDIAVPTLPFIEQLKSFQEDHTFHQTCYLIVSNDRNADLIDTCITRQQQGDTLTFLCPEYTNAYNTQTAKHFSGNAALSDFYFWEITNDET